MAELADAPDLGSGGVILAGSSPVARTKNPECGSVRDFSLFTFHFSLFTASYCRPGIFGREERRGKREYAPRQGDSEGYFKNIYLLHSPYGGSSGGRRLSSLQAGKFPLPHSGGALQPIYGPLAGIPGRSHEYSFASCPYNGPGGGRGKSRMRQRSGFFLIHFSLFTLHCLLLPGFLEGKNESGRGNMCPFGAESRCLPAPTGLPALGKSIPIAGRTRPFVSQSKPMRRSRRSGPGPVRPPGGVGGGWLIFSLFFFPLFIFTLLFFI